MSDYTPTTEVVKDAATFPRERLGEPRPIKPEAFDRWLEQVKDEARAEAWDEAVSIAEQTAAATLDLPATLAALRAGRKEQDS